MTTSGNGAVRPPGMHDVARRAGVSHQTVSRVLNDLPNVRAQTRDRVLAAISDLGYRRNSAARALVTRRSSMIGVITSGSTLWGPSSALIGVESAAREAGYYVSLVSVRSFEAPVIGDALEHFIDQSVEGVIVIAPEAALSHAADPLVARVPVVMVAADTQPAPGLHITSVDQEGGARLATRHLLGLGHRSIAHIQGPDRWFDAMARLRGWKAEMAAAGCSTGLVTKGDWTAASGYAAGRELIAAALASGSLPMGTRPTSTPSPGTPGPGTPGTGKRDTGKRHSGKLDKGTPGVGLLSGGSAARKGGSPTWPTGVFAANDLMALGLIRALHDAEIRVPQDVSVVGFDDIPGAAHFIPGLTTVRQDFRALGRQCIDILITELAGGHDTSGPIAPSLVIRESTAPPWRAEIRPAFRSGRANRPRT